MARKKYNVPCLSVKAEEKSAATVTPICHVDKCSHCWHSKGEHFRLDGSCVFEGCRCTAFGGN
jgi:hypothetical protein